MFLFFHFSNRFLSNIGQNDIKSERMGNRGQQTALLLKYLLIGGEEQIDV